MKKKNLFFLLIILLLSVVSLKAQRYQFPDDLQSFIGYAGELLKNTKKTPSEEVADIFSAIWNGGSLSTAQKEMIIKASQSMVGARATAATHYTLFYSAIINAVNERKISPSQLDGFLSVTTELADTKNSRDLLIYLKQMEVFMLSGALHANRYSRFYAPGNFEFKFIGKKDEAELEDLKAKLNPSQDPGAEIEPLPTISGPIIYFPNTDLTLATSFDSTGVQGTQGAFLIVPHLFVGKGGRFDWASVELDPDQVFCEFDNYVVDVKKPLLNAKNVEMTYTLLLKNKIRGNFEFASKARKNEYLANFPKFTSYDNDVEIDQLGANLMYQGGFTLEGRKIYSSSVQPNALSTITGTQQETGDRAFRAWSNRFLINDTVVQANNVSFSVYLGGSDSLSHGDLKFKYLKNGAQVIDEDKSELANPIGSLTSNAANIQRKKYKKIVFKNSGVPEIQLVRDRNTTSGKMPFVNNHHKFYMEADVIKYQIEKDSLFIYTLSGSQGLRPAMFESFDYYNEDRYNQLIGIYDFHPLKIFTKYAEKIDSNAFYVQDLARVYRKNEGIIRGVASSLRTTGYLNYDPNTGLVSLTSRIEQTEATNDFIKAVDRVDRNIAGPKDSIIYNARDHDNFLILSSVKDSANAVLSRSSNELVIRGIKSFPISEALNVTIIPDSTLQRVHVYGGRNLYMEKGEITIGNFRFIGRDFFLLYDEFRLEMPIIDQILFKIQDTLAGGGGEWHEYGGEIDFKPGGVTINDHLNKSGRKHGKIAGTDLYYESYPNLSIPQGGEVYFSTEYRQKFSYDSTRAFFKLDPINMDSLNTKVPIFPGKFISNIFPTFEEDLVPMQYPDQTMGFVHTPPEAGYPLYPENTMVKGAKILFNRNLIMNEVGLLSGGKVTYLTTTLNSPEYIFMPDSVTSDNINFQIEAGELNGSQFAQAQGKTAQLDWLVQEDKMLITNKEEMLRLEDARDDLPAEAFAQRYKDKLFTLYSNENPITLRGNLDVSVDGLRGEGNLVRKDFSILSVTDEPFKFGKERFTANNVEFRINSKDRDPFLFDQGQFYTDNKEILNGNFVNVDFNIAQRKAVVQPDDEFADFTSLRLPYAEYRTSIKEAIWDLDKKSITMNGDSTSYFTSTIFGGDNYNEENLTFKGTNAFYDINNLSMLVEGIPFINSADASIVPKDGKTVILKDAEMQELKEARVLIDTLNRYHRLFDGNIRIKSRLAFEGDATYQFINVEKDTFNVKFDEFQLIEDTEDPRYNKRKNVVPRYTFAQGTVNEEDNFYITSRVLYKGQIKMYANRQNLTLDGFIKLDLSTRSDFNEWIPYKSDKGDSVFLAVDEKLETDAEVITSGLHFAYGSSDLYTTFLSPKQGDRDNDVFLASGILDYNPSINEFKISPQGRRDGTNYVGNRLIFDDSQATIFLEGKFDILDPIASKYVKSAGAARINIKEETYNFDAFLTFDLPILKGVQMMQSDISRVIDTEQSSTSISLNQNDAINYKIANIIGEKEFSTFKESIGVRPIPILELAKDLKKALVFSKVDFAWSEEYKTFYSQGPLHLFSVFDKIFNEDVTGFVELRKNSQGDGFIVYLQPDPDVWYYFELENFEGEELILALSSDDLFNDVIIGKGVELAGIDKKEAFINKFRALYGADEIPRSSLDDEFGAGFDDDDEEEDGKEGDKAKDPNSKDPKAKDAKKDPKAKDKDAKAKAKKKKEEEEEEEGEGF